MLRKANQNKWLCDSFETKTTHINELAVIAVDNPFDKIMTGILEEFSIIKLTTLKLNMLKKIKIYLLLLLGMFLNQNSNAQWTDLTISPIDTAIKNEIIKTTVDTNTNGQKIKETVFKNGRIDYMSFYKDNKVIRTIGYNSSGVVEWEWNDPEIENSKHRQTRNISLAIVSIFLLSFLWLSWKKFGYTKTYYIVGYSTILITAIAFLTQNRIDYEQTNQFLIYTISSVVFFLPVLLLTLSFSNFFRKTGIHILFSIIFTVFCIWILLIYTMATLTAGVGVLS